MEDIKKDKKKYSAIEKFKIGAAAMSGIQAAELSKESGMSRTYVYQQKAEVERYAETLNTEESKEHVIIANERFIKRSILSLTLDCGSSADGIRRYLENVCGISLSAGYISGVINAASQNAQKFDDSISLEGISQGANDEIFQKGIPILTGIDPVSSYIYLLEEGSDRSAQTWKLYMQDRKERGLELEVSISDRGSGLISGIPQAFPEISIQSDVFHAIYGMGKEISRAERRAYRLINEESDLLERSQGKRPHKKTKESLEKVIPLTKEAINLYDKLSILYIWLKELLSFSGYSMNDTTVLINYVIEEIKKIAAPYPRIIKECEKILRDLPQLLSYIKRLDNVFEQIALQYGVPPEALRMMYHQKSLGTASLEYQNTALQLGIMLGESYFSAVDAFNKSLELVKKASSLVENLNGRIRSYIEVKRIVPTRFFVLMKVYFNTRRYKRSRCKERIGKSPLELLKGTPQPDFFEAIGF